MKNTTTAIVLIILATACSQSISAEPMRLVQGEHRGTNSGDKSMADASPESILRGLVLATGDTGFECDQDKSVNPTWAACVGDTGDSYTLDDCRLGTCDIRYNAEVVGTLHSRVNGDTWSAIGGWDNQSFTVLRDGSEAIVIVK